MSEKKPNGWEATSQALKQEYRWLPKGREVTVYLDDPVIKEIPSRFKKGEMQKVHVVRTDIGYCYVNDLQVIDIARLMAMNSYKTPVSYTRR